MRHFLSIIAGTFLSLILLLALPAYAAQTHSTDLESGSSQYWSITDASQTGLNPTTDMSISLWVKFESLPASGQWMAMVSKFDTNTDDREYYFALNNNSGTYRLAFVNSTTGGNFDEGFVTWSTPMTGTWYHIGVSKAGTTATMYVDGSSIGSDTVFATQFDGDAEFDIGRRSDAVFYLDGLVDEVLVYSNDIGAQMATNESTPCTPYATDLISQWQFNNDGTDNVASNDLTNNNSITFSTDLPFECAAAATFQIWPLSTF